MTATLTSNAQAILLLTAPLVAGRMDSSANLLSWGDYNRLARILRERHKQPADLLGPNAGDVMARCAEHFGRERLEALLGRGFLLSQAMERWNARAIWIVSRADPSYPKRLKSRLREDAPPVLYGCGSISLLERGGFAVVGSRHIDDELIRYAENVGRVSSEARCMIVSGGAKGIDRAAMNGALQAGGHVAGVLADSLERAALARENREPLMEGRLVLFSPYDPSAGFNVGHAMQRNKLIYALADAALVVTSDFEKGGTWAGAIEQVDRLRFVPVFVRIGDNAGEGNTALLRRGALQWPDPKNAQELQAVFAIVSEANAAQPRQETLSLGVGEEASEYEGSPVQKSHETPVEPKPASRVAAMDATALSDELFTNVRRLLTQALGEARTEEEVATLLLITKPQAKAWLTKLVEEGVLEKVRKSKPPRFRTAPESERLI